jgi:hypothetical protein
LDHSAKNRCSAFSIVVKEELPKSFIAIKDKNHFDTPNKEPNQSNSVKINLSSPQRTNIAEDSDSTNHSHKSQIFTKKCSKEEKRHQNFQSIMKLIKSRKADTFQELEKIDDEVAVLKCSPKPYSKNTRLSKYRGVSHNGKKWQVMIMGFAKKIYFGGISTEDEASHKYDKYAILMHGLEVRIHQLMILSNSTLYRLRRTMITIRENCERFSIPTSI